MERRFKSWREESSYDGWAHPRSFRSGYGGIFSKSGGDFVVLNGPYVFEINEKRYEEILKDLGYGHLTGILGSHGPASELLSYVTKKKWGVQIPKA